MIGDPSNMYVQLLSKNGCFCPKLAPVPYIVCMNSKDLGETMWKY